MYMLPNMITRHGFSKTEMGFIIGSSSLFGAAFDFWLSKFVRHPHYRRLYLAVMLLMGLYAMILYGANSLWLYLFAMGIWGMYWDLFHFGNYDFVSRTAIESERSSTFGVMGVFYSLGSLIAPLIAGLVIGEIIDATPFVIFGLFLCCAVIMYVISLTQHSEKPEVRDAIRVQPTTFFGELVLWGKLGKQMYTLLALMLLIFTVDSFFLTIGPLIAEQSDFGAWGGLLLTVYFLPGLFTGWFVGSVTKKMGKKKTAMYAYLLGCLTLCLFAIVNQPGLSLVLVGVAAFFFSFCLPSISGAFADYISETKQYEKEIQGLSDFFYNIGWIIGPISAGFLADVVGNKNTFLVLGVFGILMSVILVKLMPSKIRLKITT
jgi:MFS family permease